MFENVTQEFRCLLEIIKIDEQMMSLEIEIYDLRKRHLEFREKHGKTNKNISNKLDRKLEKRKQLIKERGILKIKAHSLIN